VAADACRLAHTARVAHDRGRVVQENARHWRQLADVAVDDAEQRANRFLVGGDAVEIAHLSKAAATDHPALVSITMQVP
jgi:hypothetical protein